MPHAEIIVSEKTAKILKGWGIKYYLTITIKQ